MTKPDRRTTPDRRVADPSTYLREECGLVARTWVRNGAKPETIYTFVDNRWVEIRIQYNGEENPPRRREADLPVRSTRTQTGKESDFLAPQESRLDALMSDRSQDA